MLVWTDWQEHWGGPAGAETLKWISWGSGAWVARLGMLYVCKVVCIGICIGIYAVIGILGRLGWGRYIWTNMLW